MLRQELVEHDICVGRCFDAHVCQVWCSSPGMKCPRDAPFLTTLCPGQDMLEPGLLEHCVRLVGARTAMYIKCGAGMF